MIVDEAHVKACLQYSYGIFFGRAVNNPTKVANAKMFFSFCLAGGPKYLYRMLPVKELHVSFLLDDIKKAVVMLLLLPMMVTK